MRAFFGLCVVASFASAAPASERAGLPRNLAQPDPSVQVDNRFPYTGAPVPFGDRLDPTINGNGKGFTRLSEPPAVVPILGVRPSNNINVISLTYLPDGINIHFQTPFGIGDEAPCVEWGETESLGQWSKGLSTTYDRTPPCSLVDDKTQCSQYFHNVEVRGLCGGKKYYYRIPGGNGTQPSDILSFTTARPAGEQGKFSVSLVNDMGYTFAQGTWDTLLSALASGSTEFVIHGGDISYADDWVYGLAACPPLNTSIPLESQYQPRCYNGSDSTLPFGVDDPQFYVPPPAGEGATQGGPRGGDLSTIYETNWDTWQNWMNPITTNMVYMTLPGNHEAACTESDWGNNSITAILNLDLPAGSSAPASNLSYWSCPPSQRNFTAYQYRFPGPGSVTNGSNGVGAMWYSFDYGLAHFISFSSETDYPFSGEYPFVGDLLPNETLADLKWDDAWVTGSGPFGALDGNWTENESYEQWHWLKNDLAQVDRNVTPWVFAMAHRPMYSSQTSGYQKSMRNAWEQMLIKGGVDAYVAGHVHWYERMWPLNNFTIDHDAIINNHTYQVNPGKSLIHLTNGQAGNIESHSTLGRDPVANYTAYLDYINYGSSRLTVYNESAASFEFIRGVNQTTGDFLWVLK